MFRRYPSLAMWPVLCLVLVAPTPADAQITQPPRPCDIGRGDIVTGPLDPGAPGPYTAVRTEYNLGNSAAQLPDVDYPVELRAEVTYPEELACGPFPIVFIMHGGHSTCLQADGGITGGWPCEPVDQTQEEFCGTIPGDFCDPHDPTLPSYKGYRYLADRLASQGMIVVSISANGINAEDATGAPQYLEARAQLFRRHFGLWLAFSTSSTAPFGSTFVGRVDLKRVGIIGHSRGGGGAARLVDLIAEQDNPFGTIGAKGAGVRIKGVLLVGPVDADDETQLVTGTPFGVILPYCDGDQEEMPGVGYYDGSRYAVPGDSGPKHSFEIIGANHNNFNTLWDPHTTEIDAVDDWSAAFPGGEGPFCQPVEEEPFLSGRLTSAEQQGTLIAIAGAFFRTYLKNESAFRPFLRGEAPPPPSAMTSGIFVGYHPKDESMERLDVDRITVAEEVTSYNTLGGVVDDNGLTTFEFCDGEAPDSSPGCLTDIGVFPSIEHVPHAYFSNGPQATQLRIAWDNLRPSSDSVFSNELPDGFRDVSRYRAFQFRAFVDFASPLNPPGVPQDLRIVLRDGAGLQSSVVVSDYSSALFFPPSVEPFATSTTYIPRAILNTVRVPLSAFSGVFLQDIRSVELVFDQTPSGAINVADLAFADEPENALPTLTCAMAETELMAGGDKLIDVGLDVTVTDDHDLGLVPTIAVFSDEDDLDSANHQSSPDAKDIAPGTLRLRAERDNNGDGRVYVVLAKAVDSDGGLGYACCAATVPAGNQQADVDSVNAQATAALDLCTSFAAAEEGFADIPDGFFAVGDGPVVGPNQ